MCMQDGLRSPFILVLIRWALSKKIKIRLNTALFVRLLALVGRFSSEVKVSSVPLMNYV